MTILPEKYIRKPLYVEAIRVTEENFAEIALWCHGEIRFNDDDKPIAEGQDTDPKNQYVRVRVHNPKNVRQTKAFVGDWILYTERGYKVYTHKAFNAAFSPA